MSADEYAPFPALELEALAAFHEEVAAASVNGYFRDLHDARAKHCRNAIASYNALNQRCLESETKMTLVLASLNVNEASN